MSAVPDSEPSYDEVMSLTASQSCVVVDDGSEQVHTGIWHMDASKQPDCMLVFVLEGALPLEYVTQLTDIL